MSRSSETRLAALPASEKNTFVLAAARAVIANPGGAYNPLFLVARSDAAVAELNAVLRAVAAELGAVARVSGIVRMSGSTYVRRVLAARRRRGGLARLRSRLASAGALLVSDLDPVEASPAATSELRRVIVALHARNAQMVFVTSSDGPAIRAFLNRLSVLEWTMLVPLTSP